MSLNLARVTKLYPAIPAADIIMLGNGWPTPRVPIMCDITSDSGASGLPDMTPLKDEREVSSTAGNVVLAVVGRMNGHAIILGFLPPAIGQMLFADGRQVKRYPSDVYVTCDKDGNTEVYHPSGTYFRIGEDPEHDDLSGRDVNQSWKLAKNLTRAPTVRLRVAAGGVVKGTVQLDSAGTLSATVEGDVQVNAGGNIIASAQGEIEAAAPTVTLRASQEIVLDAQMVRCTGTLDAAVDVLGGPTKTSLSKHTHGGVLPGPSITSPPVA